MPADPSRSDLTPPELIAEYVTEDGAHPPDEIAALVDRTPFLREGYALIGAVGAMPTVRALSGQRAKWNAGLISLMTTMPLSKRTLPFWLQHIGLGLNVLMRLAFVALLAASVSVSQFVWSWWWLTPTVLAALYQLKMAHLSPHRTRADYLFAVLWLPGELWLWFSGWNTAKSWVTHLLGKRRDLWAAQAAAEAGKRTGNGSGALLGTLLGSVVVSSVGAWYWLTQASVEFQRSEV